MKLDFNQNNVQEMAGMGEARISTMHTSAMAFDILSKRIYKNKIKAPIQELSCNAKDAHTMVGQPELPIEVKLPNSFDAEFYVKDWGPGLSEEDVMNLYMTYFMSTKSDSDAFTGAFGLGSKSPFSYTDQFFVTSAQNGIQTTYLAFRNNQGMPSISKVEGSTMPSPANWQHGLQVGFPAAVEDFKRFSDEASNVFRWFEVTPNVKGSYESIKPSFIYEDSDFAIMAPSVTRGRRGSQVTTAPSVVRMGSVGYEIEAEPLKDIFSAADLALMTSGLMLKMDIGSISVTASRESLEYDEKTIGALKAKLKVIMKTLVSIAVDAIGTDAATRSLNTIIERLLPFHSALSHYEWLKKFEGLVYAALVAENKDLNLTDNAVAALVRLNSIELPGWTGVDGDATVSMFELNRKKDYIQKSIFGGHIGTSTSKATLSLMDGPLAIVIDDVSYAAGRCKLALSNDEFGQLIFISGKNAAEKKRVADKLSAELCNIPVIQATSLNRGNEPVRIGRTKGSQRLSIADRLANFGDETVRVLRADGTDGYFTLSHALKLTQVYVVGNFTSDVVKGAGNPLPFDNMIVLLRALALAHPVFVEKSLTSVIVLSTTNVQKFKAEETLTLWETAVVEQLKAHQNTIETTLKSLPAYINRPYYAENEEGKTNPIVINPLMLHLEDWMLTYSNIRAGYPRFMMTLDKEVQDTVKYYVAALGKKEPSNGKWELSDSAELWHGITYLMQLLPGESNVATELRSCIDCARDKVFHQTMASYSTYFAALAERAIFTKFVNDYPESAAAVYNSIWQLGKQDATACKAA